MDYRKKDLEKFKFCNKLLSRGIKGSSSYEYSKSGLGKISPDMVNTGSYIESDIVGISVNGERKNSKLVNMAQLKKICASGAVVVKDNGFHTARKFNIGERHLEKQLLKLGYVRTIDNLKRGIWNLLPKSIRINTVSLSSIPEKTRRINMGRELFLNATVKTGTQAFAPTWSMVQGVKSGKITRSDYKDQYLAMMRKSFSLKNKAWKELLIFKTLTIACYCSGKNKYCHRHLLAECICQMATKLGINCRINPEIIKQEMI
jgi:hypothetical protein